MIYGVLEMVVLKKRASEITFSEARCTFNKLGELVG
jgi:hypothetical protein